MSGSGEIQRLSVAVLIDGKPADYRKDHVLAKGQTVTLRTPGGGGFGTAGPGAE